MKELTEFRSLMWVKIQNFFSALSVTRWWMYTVPECFLAAIVKLENTLLTANTWKLSCCTLLGYRAACWADCEVVWVCMFFISLQLACEQSVITFSNTCCLLGWCSACCICGHWKSCTQRRCLCCEETTSVDTWPSISPSNRNVCVSQ